MVQTIYPGQVKRINVVVANGQTSGTKAHKMGTKPEVGAPNPSVEDGANNGARASADNTDITVTTPVPTSQDITYTVMAVIPAISEA